MKANGMALPEKQDFIMNWSMTEQSPCYIVKAHDIDGIRQGLTAARANGLSIIAHGAGHSYTDAALNTNGVIIDVTGMRRILAWNPEQGIIQVEPGVTLLDIVRLTLPDLWWPPVTPSTADATIGGCVAMNVNGKNAWKCGSFGEHLLSVSVLLSSGQLITLSPESNPQFFRALVGSSGLLGIITSITLQLQRITSWKVDTTLRPAASISEILSIFQEEQAADFLEAWVDGFAEGGHLGRGVVMCTKYSDLHHKEFRAKHQQSAHSRIFRISNQPYARNSLFPGKIFRPTVKESVHIANSVMYRLCTLCDRKIIRQRSLFHGTYYSPAMYAVYRTLLHQGTETFQAFVPRNHTESVFKEIMQQSQEKGFLPLWCIIKQHRKDPFLLSYQVDGFSLEVNYHKVPQTAQKLHQMLLELMESVIQAGGRFYFAKDSLLTNSLYRQSIGEAVIEEFLNLKKLYDPEMLFQSNLFRRVFQASLLEMESRSQVDFGYEHCSGNKL